MSHSRIAPRYREECRGRLGEELSLRNLVRRSIWTLLRPFQRRLLNPIPGRLFTKVREELSATLLFDTVMGFASDCGLSGDYLEFGCAGGNSMTRAYHAAKRYANLSSMRFFAFDSFQGLPESKGLDAVLTRYTPGDFRCGLEQYQKNLRKNGVDLRSVTCVPGWYNESLTPEVSLGLQIARAAVILIDCDLYESTVPVLNFITPYLQDGTILIFDDWFSFKGRIDLGEARALQEWLERTPQIRVTEFQRTGRTMMTFVVQVIDEK